MVAGVIPGGGGGDRTGNENRRSEESYILPSFIFQSGKKKRHDKMTRGGMKAGNVHVTSLFFFPSILYMSLPSFSFILMSSSCPPTRTCLHFESFFFFFYCDHINETNTQPWRFLYAREQRRNIDMPSRAETTTRKREKKKKTHNFPEYQK